MPVKHVNAYDVFPPEIVKGIQMHYSRGYLWIPKSKADDKRATRKPSKRRIENKEKQNLVDIGEVPILS